MRKTKREFQQTNRKLGLICFLAVNLWLAFPAGAWGPLAHFTAAPHGTQLQQNLPDLWESHEYAHAFDFPSYAGKEVSEYFGWSHACQRNGLLTAFTGSYDVGPFSVSLVDVVYPDTPTAYNVPAGVELPGMDMYYIWANKFLAGNQTNLRKKTAQGFVGHNEEDEVVHFSYFLGGSVYNWLVEHALKERWAEFEIYLFLGGGWDPFGGPSMTWSMGCSADAGIINLGQKLFRKNRQTVDAVPVGGDDTIVVETAAEISTRISDQDEKLSEYFSGIGLFNEFNYAKYLYWSAVADAAGWNSTTMTGKYTTAKTDALAAITAMP